MTKRCAVSAITVIAVFCMLIFMPVTANAGGEHIYTAYDTYKATIYLCDGQNETVILKDLEQISDTGVPLLTSYIYGNEIPFYRGGLRLSDWTKLTPEEVNERYLDKSVLVVVGRNGWGVRVLMIKFD